MPTKPNNGPAISLRIYPTDKDEAAGIAAEIAQAGASTWGNTAVLGRTRALLTPVLEALRTAGVKAAIVTRRDRFISPQFVWLQTCLDQSLRPTDRQVFLAMANAANRIAGTELDASIIEAEATAAGHSLLEHWALAAQNTQNAVAFRLAELALRLVQSRSAWRAVVTDALAWLPETAVSGDGVVSDAVDDKAAWETAAKAIRSEKGSNTDLAELLQGIALRPKEPPPDVSAVGLFTVHSAKGLEFDHVWVLGLAETVLPSWQSLQSDAKPAELEEERRNCFVAITRTRNTLILTRADNYRGWAKVASRFLDEMKLL